MTESNIIQLKKELTRLGIRDTVPEIEYFRNINPTSFMLYSGGNPTGDDQLLYALRYNKNEKGLFQLAEYKLTLKSVPIPEVTIQGINTKELVEKMEKADELYNEYLNGNQYPEKNHVIESAHKDLEVLLDSGEKGKDIAHRFMFKYWPESEYRKYIPDDTELRQKYEAVLSVPANGNNTLTANQAYEKITDRFKEHVITDELLTEARLAFSKGDHWIAHNTIPYYLDKGDMYFFKTADEAREFSADNISEYDNYRLTHAYSTDDLLRQIPYGEKPERQLVNPDANGLYDTDGNAFTDALIEHFEQQQILNNKKLSIMNEKNFDYLKDNLKYMGFGEKQHDTLAKHLKEGKDSFQMTFSTEINQKPFEAVMQFRKSEKSDMYFLNSYKASLEWANGEKKEQTFYLNYGKGVTAKEAYNLLDGRSVEKEIVRKLNDEEKLQFKAELKLPREEQGLPQNWEKAPTYKAWLKLDFEKKDEHNNYDVRQLHEKYGYNLEETVRKFGVSEMDGGEKEKALLQSLRKGNVQSVSIEVNGESQKMFIEANPEYKTLNLYNEKMKPLNKEERVEFLEKLGVKEVKSEQKQQEVKPESPKQNESVKNDKSKKNDSLLPKKRNRTKKGLGHTG